MCQGDYFVEMIDSGIYIQSWQLAKGSWQLAKRYRY
jgi:hypothetical protein